MKCLSKPVCIKAPAKFLLTLYSQPGSWQALTKSKWLAAAAVYMQKWALANTKWVAVIHNETNNQHIHIVACRVKSFNDQVSWWQNDYKKIHEAAREIESKFGLIKVANPGESFGTEYSIRDTKAGRGKGTEAAARDPVFIIRAIFKSIMKDSKPETITDLVNKLSGRGVLVKVVTNQNQPTGIK